AEMVENYVLLPRILGESLGLHPVVVILAIMAGGASMGMFGLLIALPLTASLVILAREYLLPVLAQLASKEAGKAPAACPVLGRLGPWATGVPTPDANRSGPARLHADANRRTTGPAPTCRAPTARCARARRSPATRAACGRSSRRRARATPA